MGRRMLEHERLAAVNTGRCFAKEAFPQWQDLAPEAFATMMAGIAARLGELHESLFDCFMSGAKDEWDTYQRRMRREAERKTLALEAARKVFGV